jgi:NAD(P)-dependent dehydrogenase (short-subunit alcohol dehydrogenase family)
MKHLVITGATRGLGRELALGFAKNQWVVSACGTSPEALETLRAELPDPHFVHPCDVTSAEEVGAFARAALDRQGPPDMLVNNAALINRPAMLWEVPPEEFSRVVDVNLKGVHLVLRAFLPAMIARGQGIIINLSSGWGRSTSPEVGPYCATKWGVEGLTRALAQELPEGLAAMPLNPGVIHTEMLASCFGDEAAAYPTPAEWATRAVPYLLGLGPDLNGTPLTVPGA